VGQPLYTIQTTATAGDDIFKLKLSLFAPEAKLNLKGAPKDWKIGEVVKRTLDNGSEEIGTQFIESLVLLNTSTPLILQRVSIPAVLANLPNAKDINNFVTSKRVQSDAHGRVVVVMDTCTYIAQVTAKSAAYLPLGDISLAKIVPIITPTAQAELINKVKNKPLSDNFRRCCTLIDITMFPDEWISRRNRMWIIFYTEVLAGFDLLDIGEEYLVAWAKNNREFMGNASSMIDNWKLLPDAKPDAIAAAQTAAQNAQILAKRRLPLSYDNFVGFNPFLQPANTRWDVFLLLETAYIGALYVNKSGLPVFYTKDGILYTILEKRKDKVKLVLDLIGQVRWVRYEKDI